MATIDSNGVLIYQDTDNYTPIQTALNLAQSNLSSILGANIQVVKVANTADRDAKAAARGGISKANPFVAWRADALDGLQLEYTTNGTTWRTLADKEYYDGLDTGWQSVPLASGFTGSLFVRRHVLGTTSQVSCRGSITGTWTALATTAVATIPEGFRPGAIHPNPSIFSNGDYNWGNVTTGGVVSSRKTATGSSTLFIGTSWLT